MSDGKKTNQLPAVTREIVNIRDKVYVATGYDASFMSMIVGPQGIIIVDSGANPKASSALMAQFRTLSDKPLKALIFTHSHPDHIGGAAGIMGMEQKLNPSFNPHDVEIWARSPWGSEFGLAELLPDIFKKRTLRQTGMALPPEKRGKKAPVEPFPDPAQEWPVAPDPVYPNHFLTTEQLNLNLAGLDLELYAAPGETSDHLFLWLPEDRIGFAGDNIFGTFPNLYAIRGTGYRDVAAWIQSLKHMHDFEPHYLIMGHSAPLMDAATCAAWLGDHYEAVNHVYQATLEGMNKGMSPDELAGQITLPAHLADKPYLAQLYGNVAWSVRGIFTGHLGWFDGEARKLTPLSPTQEANHMAELAGGLDSLLQRGQEAMTKGSHAWAAQLASYVLVLEPDRADAKTLLADALEEMAQGVTSQTGRFYMLTCAQELRVSQ